MGSASFLLGGKQFTLSLRGTKQSRRHRKPRLISEPEEGVVIATKEAIFTNAQKAKAQKATLISVQEKGVVIATDG